MKYEDFLNNLLRLPFGGNVNILEKPRKLTFMARYRSVNLPDEYIKAFFADGSFLLTVPQFNTVMFTEKLLHEISEIAREDFGKTGLAYDGQIWKLVNDNDYQYVTQVYAGETANGEGECHFWDYESENDKNFLSLGVLSRNNERADIYVSQISPSSIVF